MIFNNILILSFLLLFTACGGDNTSSASSTSTLKASAGEDKSVYVNNSISLIGTGSSSRNSPLTYLWKKEGSVISTSATLQYTPTLLGTDKLTFTVTDDAGATATDSVNILVTEFHLIPAIQDSEKLAYLKVLNDARAKEQNCGSKGMFPPAKAVVWNEKLYKAAYEHTQDMAQSNTFEHTGSGTESDWTGTITNKKSILSERYATYNYHWSWSGENLVAGTNIDTPQATIEKWLNSDGHCSNLMNPDFTEVGISKVYESNSKYKYYWTQDFGQP